MDRKKCNCEGFFKVEYFLTLKTIQSLREEIDENKKRWEKICNIMSNAEITEDIDELIGLLKETKRTMVEIEKRDTNQKQSEVKR